MIGRMVKKVVQLFSLFPLIIFFSISCSPGEDQPEATNYALKVRALTVQVIEACQKKDFSKITPDEAKRVKRGIDKAVNSPTWISGLNQLPSPAKESIFAQLATTQECLQKYFSERGTVKSALTPRKSALGEGDNGVQGEVGSPELGYLTVEAQVSTEALGVVLGFFYKLLSESVERIKEIGESVYDCVTDISYCMLDVTYKNTWCAQDAHEKHPTEAKCAEGCCSHAMVVEVAGCLRDCAKNEIDTGKFDECKDVTVASDGFCAWGNKITPW